MVRRRKMTAKQAKYFAPRRSRARTRTVTKVRRVYVKARRHTKRGFSLPLGKLAYGIGALAGAAPIINALQGGPESLMASAQASIGNLASNPIGGIRALATPDVIGPPIASLAIQYGRKFLPPLGPVNKILTVAKRSSDGFTMTHLLARLLGVA